MEVEEEEEEATSSSSYPSSPVLLLLHHNRHLVPSCRVRPTNHFSVPTNQPTNLLFIFSSFPFLDRRLLPRIRHKRERREPIATPPPTHACRSSAKDGRMDGMEKPQIAHSGTLSSLSVVGMVPCLLINLTSI